MNPVTPQIAPPINNIPQKLNRERLLVGFGVLVILLLTLIFYLFFRTKTLEKKISDLQVTPTPSSAIFQGPGQEKMTSTYSGKGFSFMYPEDLYPVSDVFENGDIVSFYLDEYHAKKTEECQKLNKEILEDPCGFGWLVLDVDIFINSKDNNSNFDSLIGNDSISIENYTDLQGRQWQIVQSLPEAGSRLASLNIWGTKFTSEGNTYLIYVGGPYYSSYRVNLNFVKQILSTFSFGN